VRDVFLRDKIQGHRGTEVISLLTGNPNRTCGAAPDRPRIVVGKWGYLPSSRAGAPSSQFHPSIGGNPFTKLNRRSGNMRVPNEPTRMSAMNQFPGWKRTRRPTGHCVCFHCRKMFRKFSRTCPCPQCGQGMIDMGPYFEPPRKSNRRMWELLAALAGQGYRFYSEGSRAFFFGPWSGDRTPSSRTVMHRIRSFIDYGMNPLQR
jgi:hypothetical protein